MQATISVVVAARDEERLLGSCLRSVARQDGVDWVCVVVDDGSTDRTRTIAEEYRRADPRFLLEPHDSPRGLGAARNTGVAATRSDLVTFLDADDLLYPGALARRARRISDLPAGVTGCYGDWVSVPEWAPPLLRRFRAAARPGASLLSANRQVPFIASAPVLPRDLFEAIGGFDEGLPTGEDADLWARWLRLAGTVVYEPVVAVGYRRRAGSMTREDPAGHFRANREAFSSVDRAISDPVNGLLHRPESWYREQAIALPRAALAATQALASGDHGSAEAVLGEIDPLVIRIAGPGSIARDAHRLARRRARGTRGATRDLLQLRGSRERLSGLLEEMAASPVEHGELVEAARRLRKP